MCLAEMGNGVDQWRTSNGGWMSANIMGRNSQCQESCSSPWFQLLVLVVLLIIGGIELNPGPKQVSFTYTQVNITIMLIPVNQYASAGGAHNHMRDSAESRPEPGECHLQIKISIMLIPMVPAASVGGALNQRKDSIKSQSKPGKCHIHTS